MRGELIQQLLKSLGPETTPDEAKRAIKAYWEHPENIASRARTLRAETDNLNPEFVSAVAACAMGREGFGDEFLDTVYQKMWPSIHDYDNMHPDNIRLAKAVVVEILLNQDFEILPRDIREIAAKLLRGDIATKRKRHTKSPGVQNIREQLANAVRAVHHATNHKFTLSSSTSSRYSAFGIVSEATGKDFEAVRDAFKDCIYSRSRRRAKKKRASVGGK